MRRINARTSEVLPVPEGAATTYNFPRGRGLDWLIDASSLDVLHLLAHLFDHDLHVDGGAGRFHVL